MKKLIFTVVTCLMLSLASCGSSADYEAIHKKLERDEQPTAADYSAMATYLEDGLDKMKSLKDDGKDDIKGMEEFEKEYPYYFEFTGALVMAEASGDLDNSTKEKLEKVTSKAEQFKQQ